MEVGPWQVYGVPRQIVLLLQAVATLVEVGANGLSRKAPYVVLEESRSRYDHHHLPRSRSRLLGKRLTPERRPALHGVEHLLGGTLTVLALSAAADEHLSGTVALNVIINAVAGRNGEKLAARVFPHLAVVPGLSLHGALLHTIVKHDGVARVSHAHLHLGRVRERLGPVVAPDGVVSHALCIEQCRNVAQLHRHLCCVNVFCNNLFHNHVFFSVCRLPVTSRRHATLRLVKASQLPATGRLVKASRQPATLRQPRTVMPAFGSPGRQASAQKQGQKLRPATREM